MAGVTIYFQHGRAIGSEIIPIGNILTWQGFQSRVAIAGVAMLFYFWKSILPFGLLPIYPRWEVEPPAWYFYLAWPAIALVLLWLWTKRKTWGRHVLFGLGFFLTTLFPVLGFITMSYMRITWVADHFLYLPVIGLIGLATAAVGELYEHSNLKRRRYLLTGGLAIFTLLVFSSHRYAGIFYNEEAMWTYTLKSNPDAWQAHSRLGKVMIEKGNNDAAYYHISESVRLRPDLAETHNNMGAMLEKKGETEKALMELRTASRIAPDITIYRINLGSLLVRMGQYQEGSEVYEGLLEKDPNNPTFLCNYGVALYFLGRNDEAIENFQRALKINPELKDARENLQAALKKKSGIGVVPSEQPQLPASSNFLGGTAAIQLFGN